MDFPTDMPTLGAALQTFLINHGADIPEPTRGFVIDATAGTSPTQSFADTAEALYANADSLQDEARTMAAQLAQFCANNILFGMSIDNRGGRIAQAMQRRNGEAPPEGMDWPDPSSDPAPQERFVPGEPEEEEEA